MSEFANDSEQYASSALGSAVLEFLYKRGDKVIFLSERFAETLLDEYGLRGKASPETETALTAAFGEIIRAGMLLDSKGTVDTADVMRCRDELVEGLQSPASAILGDITPLIIERGIAFHRDEVYGESPRLDAWINEYESAHPTK